MLSFDIASLHASAVAVSGDLGPDDSVWEEADPRPAGGVHVTGRLSATPGGQYIFRGKLKGEVASECRRCLTDLQAPVSEEVQFIFADEGADGADDPEVFLVDERAQEIDLRPAIREQWLLSVPGFAVCKEDCKGLCPSCGTDLNTTQCDCAQAAADTRWAALQQLRQRPHQ